MTPLLGAGELDEKPVRRAAADQAAFARELLQRRRDVDLLILSHTHRPVLLEVEPDRWYLNPGSWWETQSFAVVTASGPALRTYGS